MSGTIEARYSARVREGQIERDPAQEAAVRRLDKLCSDLAEHRLARKSSALGWLSAQGSRPAIRAASTSGDRWARQDHADGPVLRCGGRCSASGARISTFMADVHARVHEWRQKKKAGEVKGDDPIAPVADDLAKDAWLLCFDEFAVTDIADAMILGACSRRCLRGVVVVTTSNVEPGDLYRDGLNRALFLPFIAMIRDRMEVYRLESRTDFRLEKLSASSIWFTPLGPQSTAHLQNVFQALTGVERGAPTSVRVFGRDVRYLKPRNVARCSYDDLCGRPLGASTSWRSRASSTRSCSMEFRCSTRPSETR